MRLGRVMSGLLVAMLAMASAPARAEPLKDSETLFSSGDFDASAKKVNELLLHEDELKSGERAKLYLMKARLENAFGRKPDVRLWLEKAYQTDPTLSLDPVLDPPPLHTAWSELKKAAKSAPPAEDSDHEPSGASVSVLAGMLPFGMGHGLAGRYRDGALFFSSELLILLAADTLPVGDEPDADRSQHPHAREIVGGVGFLGLYGYEVGDLLSDVGGVRTLLNFFPLGAPQAKNGDTAKALAFASLQSVFVTAGSLAPRDAQRRMALGVFGATWIYGTIDGFVNDRTGAAPAQNRKSRDRKNAAVAPFFLRGGGGLSLAVAL